MSTVFCVFYKLVISKNYKNSVTIKKLVPIEGQYLRLSVVPMKRMYLRTHCTVMAGRRLESDVT